MYDSGKARGPFSLHENCVCTCPLAFAFKLRRTVQREKHNRQRWHEPFYFPCRVQSIHLWHQNI